MRLPSEEHHTQVVGGVGIAQVLRESEVLFRGGDVHFRVTYRLVTNIPNLNQNLTLSFGTEESLGHVAVGAGGETIAFQNATYGLTVIPEPGTALLMGLGLAALATRRR